MELYKPRLELYKSIRRTESRDILFVRLESEDCLRNEEYSSAKVTLVSQKYDMNECNNKMIIEYISRKQNHSLSKRIIQFLKDLKSCNSSIVTNPHSSSKYLTKRFYKNNVLNSLYKQMTKNCSSNFYGSLVYFVKFLQVSISNKSIFVRFLAFLFIVMTFLSGKVQNVAGKVLEDPHFGRAIVNVTAAVGREAILECVAEQLGNYKVAWLRVDTQTILTIHSHVITKNHRIGVTHSEQRTWYLHVKEVKESDRGWYMCQINTDPMKSQVGYLNIVVPPDILDIETSTDLVVQEGANVSLRCAARGSPVPTIMWKRENSETIRIGNRKEVISAMGSVLHISRISRQQMGPYLCIASNGVPPSVSKRIMLIVHFPPIIWIQYQLIGAYDGQQIVLECNSEAFPKSINYWTADKGQIIPHNEKFEPILMRDAYRVHMQLIVRNLQSTDYGIYKCISKNSLGETDGTINVYRIPKPSTYNITTKNKNGLRSRLITEEDTYQTADFQTDIPDSQYLDVGNRSNFITISNFVLLLSVLSLLSVPVT